MSSSMTGVVVKDRFVIKGRIGHGAFGEIYKGVDRQFPDHQVAIKIESVRAKHPLLRHEYKVYRELVGCPGFAKAYFYGPINNMNHNALVMELLGKSLESLFDLCGRSFTIPTVFRIADSLLTGLEVMHECHLIHGDVKPENFMCGTGAHADKLYCVDFGLSKRYRDPATKQHNPLRPWKHSLTGTPRYASISNHLGKSQSRRDDLESLGYMLIYFLQGRLPWQGIKADDKQDKYRAILSVKQTTPIQRLCRGCPPQFAQFLEYARSLEFAENPDYERMHALFRGDSAPLVRQMDWEVLQDVTGVNAAVDMFGDEQLSPALIAQRQAYRAAQNAPPAPPNTSAAIAPGAAAATDASGADVGGGVSPPAAPIDTHQYGIMPTAVAEAGAIVDTTATAEAGVLLCGDVAHHPAGAKRSAPVAGSDQPGQWTFESNEIHPAHNLVRSKRGLVHKARCGPTIEKKSIHRSMYKCASCDVTICLPTCPGRCYQLHVLSKLT